MIKERKDNIQSGVPEITSFVGTLINSQRLSYVITDNKKNPIAICVRKKDLNGARYGQKVLVESIGRGAAVSDYRIYGRVVEIIGFTGDPGVDIKSILLAHKFSPEFSDAARYEADKLPDKIDARRFRGRRDLRGEKLFTIDGEGAKDLDDAVSIERLDSNNNHVSINPTGAGHNSVINDVAPIFGTGDGLVRPARVSGKTKGQAVYKLGVHIADVSAYVARNSALDRDAMRRGTSLYYADRVVPMLPQKLSNGICSLHPQVDRLALSVYMYIGADGKILEHELFESVIKSSRRISYENIYRMLEKRNDALRAEHADVLADLEMMRELSEIMRGRRLARGALDFELREAAIELDADGAPLSVAAAETTFANQIIEEFMIACNETIATLITEAGLPFIYRTHGNPNEEKIAAFIDLANGLGFNSTNIIEILKMSRGTKYEKLLSYLLLRSLEKAEYTAANIGHFGLASKCYCHFTSPIRRYPDLMIHRIVKKYIKNKKLTKDERDTYDRTLGDICEQCSERERAADEAEREIEALKKAEYMKQFLGDTFEGVVSGVTSFGMFVELENTVEGLVRVADMSDDYYEFDSLHYTLSGVNTGKTYRLGDVLTVILSRVNVERGQIDFVLEGFAVRAPFWDDENITSYGDVNNGKKRRAGGKKRAGTKNSGAGADASGNIKTAQPKDPLSPRAQQKKSKTKNISRNRNSKRRRR